MQVKPQNPYYTLTPIHDQNMFFGQSWLLRRLYSTIASRQCGSLVGPSRIGKSSILIRISYPETQAQFRHDGSHQIFVYTDLQEHLRKTSEDFFNSVNDRIIYECQKRLQIPSTTKRSWEAFENLLDQIIERGFFTVLLMDTFDSILWNKHFNEEFFSFLRAQASMGKVSYITASIVPLNQLLLPDIKSSPFFNIFTTCYVEPLTLDEARALVMRPSHEAGCPLTEDEAEQVLKLAGRHPFFIQRVCYFLFEEKSQSPTSEVNWNRVKKQVYTDLLEHFKYMWAELKTEQQEILKDEAQRKGNQPRELPALSESALFRKFVRETCQVSLFRMTDDKMIEEIKEVLKHLNDLEFLGKSDLRHLKLVSMRLKDGSVSSTIEKGKVVQQVLNEAFEQLKGPGVRRDTAPEWKSYNILYYRYFKYRLKQEQIEARLEATSKRQHYREWNQAIRDLFNALRDRETATNKQDEE